MSKRRHDAEAELPFVALMDTMTNVVGVLVIVLVMVGISMATAVKKILSDLPDVDVSTYEALKKELSDNTKRVDPEEVEEQKKKLEQELKKKTEELNTLDLSPEAQKAKLVDLDDLQKQIQARKYDRDKAKIEADKILAELDKMKALLDQTPTYVAPESTVIRLPNPRPYPAKPLETRVLVAEKGAIIFNEAEFMAPILDGLSKLKPQLQYRSAKFDPFEQLMVGVFGSKPAALSAWPEVGALIGTYQIGQVAQAYKALADAGLRPTKHYLLDLGEISLGLAKPLSEVGAAVAAASKGDFTKWLALDPGIARNTPLMKANAVGNKVNFAWSTAVQEVRNTPNDIAGYFKDLAKHASFKDRSKSITVYDFDNVYSAIERVAANPLFAKGFIIKPALDKSGVFVNLELSPGAGAGENLEAMNQPGSNFQRTLRQLKTDPNSVAVLQILPTAFQSYHEVRRIVDLNEVPSRWEVIPKLDLSIILRDYPVQEVKLVISKTGKPVNAPTAPSVTIKPPPKTLD